MHLTDIIQMNASTQDRFRRVTLLTESTSRGGLPSRRRALSRTYRYAQVCPVHLAGVGIGMYDVTIHGDWLNSPVSRGKKYLTGQSLKALPSPSDSRPRSNFASRETGDTPSRTIIQIYPIHKSCPTCLGGVTISIFGAIIHSPSLNPGLQRLWHPGYKMVQSES